MFVGHKYGFQKSKTILLLKQKTDGLKTSTNALRLREYILHSYNNYIFQTYNKYMQNI